MLKLSNMKNIWEGKSAWWVLASIYFKYYFCYSHLLVIVLKIWRNLNLGSALYLKSLKRLISLIGLLLKTIFLLANIYSTSGQYFLSIPSENTGNQMFSDVLKGLQKRNMGLKYVRGLIPSVFNRWFRFSFVFIVMILD